MKDILVLLLFVIILKPVIGQETQHKINWLTIEEAQKLHAKEPKNMLIDFYTDWCGWCKKMDKDTFEDSIIVQYINENYYAVKFNAESKEPAPFKCIYFVNGVKDKRSTHPLAYYFLQGAATYPSIAYLDENLSHLSTVPGYQSPKDIEPILNYFAEGAYKTIKWPEYSANFKSSFQAENKEN